MHSTPEALEKRVESPRQETWRLWPDRIEWAGPAPPDRKQILFSDAPALAALADALRRVVAGDLVALERDFKIELRGDERVWTAQLQPRKRRDSRASSITSNCKAPAPACRSSSSPSGRASARPPACIPEPFTSKGNDVRQGSVERAGGHHRRPVAGVRAAGLPGDRRDARPRRAGRAGQGRAAQGCSIDEVAAATGLPVYAARVLLEAGLGLHIVWRRDGRYHLGKLGRFLLDDEMTRVNFDFTRDVCYQAAAHLDESLREGRPAGPQGARALGHAVRGPVGDARAGAPSWHAFDHFYSDRAFPGASASGWRRAAGAPARRRLQHRQVGAAVPRRACRHCKSAWSTCRRNSNARARGSQQAGLAERAQLPSRRPARSASRRCRAGYDLIWMSQFLDCFSEEQIVAILRKVRAALPPGGRIWILELFWDRQRFEAAAFSLQQTSLYFTCVANGNSQMYDSTVFLALVERAGLEVTALTDGIGGYHTLLECRPAA